MLARLACVVLVGGCYSPPQPVCGFNCGSGDACPASYTCNHTDNRCHLDGTTAVCESFIDAASDVPSHYTLIPADGTTNAQVNAGIAIIFDTEIVAVDPFAIRVTADGAFVAGSTIAAIGQDTAAFHPDQQLPANATLEVTVQKTLVTARPFRGVTWHFTTGPDTVGPEIANANPAPGQINVSRLAPVMVAFTEDAIGVDATSFFIHTPTDPIPASVAYASRMATLIPDGLLPTDSLVIVELTSAIHDALGNPLVPTPWQFTTVPGAGAPAVQTTTPPVGATNVDVASPITVTFDENVSHVDTTSFTVHAFDHEISGAVVTSGATATFTPDAPMPAGTAILVILSAGITDLDGNPMLGPFMFGFTTR